MFNFKNFKKHQGFNEEEKKTLQQVLWRGEALDKNYLEYCEKIQYKDIAYTLYPEVSTEKDWFTHEEAISAPDGKENYERTSLLFQRIGIAKYFEDCLHHFDVPADTLKKIIRRVPN